VVLIILIVLLCLLDYAQSERKLMGGDVGMPQQFNTHWRKLIFWWSHATAMVHKVLRLPPVHLRNDK
jgi:hypothetical protein